MRKLALIFSSALLLAGACGDDGDDGGNADAAPQSDAAPVADAPSQADAAAALVGVGKICSVAADCAGNAGSTGCLSPVGGGDGFCSLTCATDEVATTDAQGNLPINVATNAACEADFNGSVGTTVCNQLLAVTPADNPLVANTQYTYTAACGIVCEAGTMACPGGLVCTNGACGAP